MRAAPFDTIRFRILLGLFGLAAGLVLTAAYGAATLRMLRRSVAAELGALRAASEVGSGVVSAVFDEIRAAELYLATPSATARDRLPRQRHPVANRWRFARDVQRCAGVERDDLLRRAALAGENRLRDRCIRLRIAAGDLLDREKFVGQESRIETLQNQIQEFQAALQTQDRDYEVFITTLGAE